MAPTDTVGPVVSSGPVRGAHTGAGEAREVKGPEEGSKLAKAAHQVEAETETRARDAEKTQTEPNRSDLEKAVEALNEKAKTLESRALEFSVDDETGETVVEVRDRDTGKLVRKIPPGEALSLAEGINRLMSDDSGLVLSMEL